MTKQEVRRRYFSWILKKACGDRAKSYNNLLTYLFNEDFDYILEMDGNRAEDGIDLRYKFAAETGLDDRVVAAYLDDTPCSILEMMAALSIRCEDSIMMNDDYGDRTSYWFWKMIESLGLGGMDDRNFSISYVIDCKNIFINREYQKNGKGGLFTLKNKNVDIRNTEIWYQMMYYLNEQIA